VRKLRVWEILSRFMRVCKHMGWKTSEDDNWVEVSNSVHSLVWTTEVHPSSFRRIVSNKKCVIKEGVCYHVVEPSYTAWLFSQSPSDEVLRTVTGNSAFSDKVALYDLSHLSHGENVCVKLNNTDSLVFKEFEDFLEEELKVKLQSLPALPSVENVSSDCTMPATI
jgi:hypothetical protein